MRKRRYEQITLNGKDFTLDTYLTPYAHCNGWASIHDAYTGPSENKILIWNKWYKWFQENKGDCCISSKNCNFFTIEGYVEDEHGQLYQCYITHGKNKCWKAGD